MSFSEMIALQDVKVSQQQGGSVKEVTPSRFYVVSSGVIAAAGVYWIAWLFSKLALGSFDLRASELIVQANLLFFLLICLGLVLSPWLKMQRYQVRVRGDEVRLFHYQEALVVVFGILFANIPLLFLANAVSMYERIAHISTLDAAALSYMQSSYFFHVPTMADVLLCGIFGLVLLVVKSWVFARVARRFIQDERLGVAAR